MNLPKSINMAGIESLSKFYFPQKILEFLAKPLPFFGIERILDYWSLVHFGVGFFLARYLIRSRIMLFIALIGFEIFEFYLVSQGLANPEGFRGIIADIIIGWAGWEIAMITSRMKITMR